MYYDYWRYRRFLGLTQQDVSLATGVTANRIAASERGQITLNRTERGLIEEYLTDKLLQLADLEGFPTNETSLEAAHAY